MLDTKGPEVRLETFKDGKTVLKKGDDFTITMNSVIGDNTRASVTYKTLNEYVKKGTKILLDDGAIALSVKSVSGADILCKVLQGGPVSDHKGGQYQRYSPGYDFFKPKRQIRYPIRYRK